MTLQEQLDTIRAQGRAKQPPEWLPIPATFIIDRSGIVHLAFVDADYTKRLEPAEVVRVVQGLAAATN
jgi:hypothetical protein